MAKERAEREDFPTEKECRECGRFKPISEFTESLSYKDGLHSNCKGCQAKKAREMKERWKKERKRSKPPNEKLCTTCYRTYPISNFCENVGHKDGYDTICKDCLKKRSDNYAERWIEERKTEPPKDSKICPGCKKNLPASKFWSHEKRKDGLTNYCIECHKRMIQENVVKWKKQREEKSIVPHKKECIICHGIKPIDKFYPNKRYKDGFSGTCIACEERRAREYIEQWKKEGNTLPKEKQCHSCKKTLSAVCFSFNRRKKDGLNFVCKNCERIQREEYSIKWQKEREKKDSESFTLFPKFEKTCSACGETKPVGKFRQRKNSKDGYNASCKDCDRARQRRYTYRVKASKKVIPETKFCTSCNKNLPSSAFNKCNQRIDGLNIHCRDCSNRKHREYMAKPDVKKRLKKWEKEYQKKPEVASKRRAYARKYYNKPENKIKAAIYRKKHRAKPEVKKRRSEQAKEYYQRKKKEKELGERI